MPGAPSIYYGDEIGLAGEMDPGCRGASRGTRRRGTTSCSPRHAALIALRHATPALRDVAFRPLVERRAGAAYRRGEGAGAVVVAVNAGGRTR